MNTPPQVSVVNPLQELYNLIATHRDWLIYQVLNYTQQLNYTTDTSTLMVVGKASVSRLSQFLLQAIEDDPQIPTLDPQANYLQDPIATFGILEAQHHYSQGISLNLFLGLIKYYHQAYQDLIHEGNFTGEQQDYFRLYINRFFDRLELGFCYQWHQLAERKKIEQLPQQHYWLNNHNEYINNFDSINNPVILFDDNHQAVNLNYQAVKLFISSDNAFNDCPHKIPQELSWLGKKVISLATSNHVQECFTFWVKTNQGQQCFEIQMRQILDINEQFNGTIVIFQNLTLNPEKPPKLTPSPIQIQHLPTRGELGFWCWNLTTEKINWSDEIYHIFQQNPQQFTPSYHEFLKLVDPEDIPLIIQAQQAAFQQQQNYSLDYRIILPDNSTHWIHEEAIATVDQQGNPVRIEGTMEYIPEIQQIEKLLKIREIALAIGDLTGKLSYVNRSFLTIWGYENEAEVFQQNFSNLWQNHQQVTTIIAAIDTHGQWTGEIVARRKNGNVFSAEVSANLVNNGADISLLMMIAVKEINQINTNQESLNNLVKLNQDFNLISIVPIGIFRTDLQGNVIYFNETGCAIMGLELADALGAGWLECIYEEDQKRVLTQWAIAVQEKKYFRCEYRYQKDNQTIIWLLVDAILETNEQQEIVGYVGTLTNVTARKEVEAAMLQFNQEMEAIFDTFPDLFLRINQEGKIIDYRSENSALFSPFSQQWVGKTIEEVFPESAGKQLELGIQEALRIKGLICLEYSLKIAQIKHFFEARIVPFNQNQTIAVVRNITDRKNTELALRESEERLRTLIDINTSGLVVLDYQGKVLFVNPSAEKLFGRTAIDLLGQVLGIPIALNQFTEIEIPHASGKLIFVRMNVVEIIWQGNAAYLASMTDITDLKETQEKLEILHWATEQSPVSIVITDAEGNIEYVNPKFEQLTGYTKAEVQGKNPRILKSGETSSYEYKQLWQTITAGHEWHGEFHNRKKNGGLFWEAASISPIKNQEGIITHFVAIKEDITERKLQEATLFHQANYDALTNLPNRFLAMDRLRQSLIKAERNQQRVGIMFVDLDHFKDVNDTLGHEYGDLLLKQVAQRLVNTLRKSDTVARLGGDEFLIIISELEVASQCKQIAAKILATLTQPFDLASEEAFISASIGITIYPDDGEDISLLMRNADVAMYKGKREGRNDFKFYTLGLNEATQRRVRMENLLRYAVKNNELFIVYQPFVELKSNQTVGAEALMRWQNSEIGRVSPDLFIPIAEETGMINELGSWILSQACQEVANWNQINPSLWVAVNLSPRQFRDNNFVKVINQAIINSGITPHNLELEITEKLLLEDVPGAKELIYHLHQIGFRLSIDDFGTGYSSLSYLIKFPFNILKIDRSFIGDVPYNQESIGLVKSIIAMAHSLNLKVVAEGVETIEQMDFLKSENCDYGQGYFFSKPLRDFEFREYLGLAE